MVSRVIKVEISAMYIAAALLVVSVTGLVGKTVAVGMAPDDPFPSLYAGETDGKAPEEGKVVYLTFDDGPSENTERILDILAECGAKATFFVTAQNADKEYAPVLLNRMVQEGHAIGLHSYTHDFAAIYRSPDSYLEDLSRLNDYILNVTGTKPEVYRFPGGSATVNASRDTIDAIAKEMDRRGYVYFDWDIVSGDDTTTVYPADYLARKVLDGAEGKERVVALFHDNSVPTTTPDAVRIILGRLGEEGYRFDKLTGEVEPVHIVRG